MDGSASVSAVPATQLVHDVADSAEYVPLEHASHAVDGALSKSAVPAAHEIHSSAAADE